MLNVHLMVLREFQLVDKRLFWGTSLRMLLDDIST